MGSIIKADRKTLSGNNNLINSITVEYEDPVGIIDIEGVKSEKHDDAVYNLNGQRLSKPQQGINIVNGKKVLF